MADRSEARSLWLAWGSMLAALAAALALPALAGPRSPWWPDARTAVFTYPVTLFAMVCGVGSLALRERLVRAVTAGTLDPRSSGGAAQVRASALRAWALCVAVALLGAFIAWVAAEPARVWPYGVGALALLAYHAPRPVRPRRR